MQVMRSGTDTEDELRSRNTCSGWQESMTALFILLDFYSNTPEEVG